jgi:hypothetical protein
VLSPCLVRCCGRHSLVRSVSVGVLVAVLFAGARGSIWGRGICSVGARAVTCVCKTLAVQRTSCSMFRVQWAPVPVSMSRRLLREVTTRRQSPRSLYLPQRQKPQAALLCTVCTWPSCVGHGRPTVGLGCSKSPPVHFFFKWPQMGWNRVGCR